MAESEERARHRLGILGRQLEHVGPADLRRIVFEGEPPERDVLRRAAERAAAAAGLGPVLADARTQFQDWVVRRYNKAGYDATMFGLNWGRTFGPVEDRVSTSRAVDDAVLATVAHEVIPAEDRLALGEPLSRILGLVPAPHRRPRQG